MHPNTHTLPLDERSPGRLSRRAVLAWGSGLLSALFSGCAGYRVGHGSLYPTDIQTVHVPMFDSSSFRRNLGEQLTEAVVKEIEAKTPYKVVGAAGADSTLSGRIFSETKRTVFETLTDEPRQAEVALAVAVSWADRRGDLIAQSTVAAPPALVDLTQSSYVVAEDGQSIATGHLAAIRRLAAQIVGLMEAPW